MEGLAHSVELTTCFWVFAIDFLGEKGFFCLHTIFNFINIRNFKVKICEFRLIALSAAKILQGNPNIPFDQFCKTFQWGFPDIAPKTQCFCACPQYCCLCCRFFIIFCHFIVTPHLHKIQHRGEFFFETCLRLSIFTCAKIQHT